jgi:hypothetical protein
VFAISCPSRDTSQMPGEIAKAARPSETRRRTPTLGRNWDNGSDPTMNRASGTKVASILRRHATRNKTLETKTNTWLVAPAENTRHRGV